MEREAKKMAEKDEKHNEVMEQAERAFMLAFETHRDLCAKISREIQFLRLHESLLAYSGPDGDFNTIATEYKQTCTYLDIVKEAAAIGRRICFLNKLVKKEDGGESFLPRKYNLQEDLVDFNNEESAGSFFRDGFELVQLFGDLYVLSASMKKANAAAAQ